MMLDKEQTKKDMLERLPKLIDLLEEQGYFLETETKICLGVDHISSAIEDLLEEKGYKIYTHATQVHDGSYMYGCFLSKNLQTFDEMSKIICDDYKRRHREDK